jgi:hypothetical protein
MDKKKSIDNLVEVEEDDFDHAIFEAMKQYEIQVQKLLDVFNEKNRLVACNHYMKYYFDKEKEEYIYIDRGKKEIGFTP